MKTDRILNGRPMPTLIRFAVPIIFGNIFQQLYNIVDAIVVGKLLGDLPLAGISAASPIMDLIYGLVTGACVGISVLMARLCGSGDWQQLKKAHATAWTGGTAVALTIALLGLLAAPWILRSEGTEEIIIEQAMIYLRIIFGGLIFNYLYVYFAALLRSCGDSRTPFLVLAGSSVLHALLDVLFIHTLNMAIYGVALSTVLCQLLSFLILLKVSRRYEKLRLLRQEMKPDASSAGMILAYAWSAALQTTVVQVGRLLVQGQLNIMGTAAVTGYNLGMRIEGIVQAIAGGISGGMVVCMSQNYGRGNADRVRLFNRCTIWLSAAYGLCVGTVLTLFSTQLLGIFTSNSDYIAAGTTYLGTMAFIYLFSCGGEYCQSSFRGLGKLPVTMFASAAQVFLRVVLSMLLVPKIGIYGICVSVGTGWGLMTLIEGTFVQRELKRLQLQPKEETA